MAEPHKLTNSQKKHYNELIESAKRRKIEDKELACLVGGTLGAGEGIVVTVLTPLTGGAPAVFAGGVGCAVGKDHIDSTFVDNKLYDRGKLTEEQHYKKLLNAAKNRRHEDEKLGCDVGKEIGTRVGNIIGPKTAAINGAIGCELGEWVVEKKYNNTNTPEEIRKKVSQWQEQLNKEIKENTPGSETQLPSYTPPPPPPPSKNQR